MHELNGYLMELVRCFSIGYSAAKKLLNPLAPEYKYEQNKKENNTPNIGTKLETKDD